MISPQMIQFNLIQEHIWFINWLDMSWVSGVGSTGGEKSISRGEKMSLWTRYSSSSLNSNGTKRTNAARIEKIFCMLRNVDVLECSVIN